MEIMAILVLLIPTWLACYVFAEESVLNKYGINDTVEEYEEFLEFQDYIREHVAELKLELEQEQRSPVNRALGYIHSLRGWWFAA